MRIRQHDYIDWNSPGTMLPIRGERPREAPLGDIDLGDDLSPEMVAMTKRTAYRPTAPELLPAERFSDVPAPAVPDGRCANPPGGDARAEQKRRPAVCPELLRLAAPADGRRVLRSGTGVSPDRTPAHDA